MRKNYIRILTGDKVKVEMTRMTYQRVVSLTVVANTRQKSGLNLLLIS